MRSKLIIYTALLVAGGCTATLYQPTENDAQGGVSLADLQQGRSLYVKNCGSCHMLHLPQEFAEDIWRRQIEEMQERAGISNSEKDKILLYLAQASTSNRTMLP